MTRPLLLVAVALCLSGCLTREHVGHFAGDAFYHVRDHYRIRYGDPGDAEARRLIPSGWVLQNFRRDRSGRPTQAFWDARHRVYVNPNNTAAGGRYRGIPMEAIDLDYLHPTTGAILFARSVPIPGDLTQRPVADLMAIVVDGLSREESRSGAGFAYGAPQQVAPRYVVNMVQHGPAEVGGAQGCHAIVDVHDTRVQPGFIDATVRIYLVLVRARRSWDPNGGPGREHGGVPMVVVFAYSASSSRFDEHVRDFESLLSRTDFH